MLVDLPRFLGRSCCALFFAVTACGGAANDQPAPKAPAETASSAPPAATSEAPSATSTETEPTPSPLAASSSPEAPAAAAAAGATPENAPAKPALPTGTLVLHVGDSFAGALGLPLNKRFKDAGVRGVLQFETASYIPGWASGNKLQGYLNRYNPDLVLITLGANELEIVNPEQRIRNIQKIVKTIGARPCVWIATPLWDGAKNGLFEIIRQNVAPCLYMDTNVLISSMPRVADGIHPTLPAREEWADVVVKWLGEHRRPNAEKPWALVE